MIDNSYSESKTQGLLEEDFYLSSSDKMVFMMRELKSELNPDKIQDIANPFHVGKLPPSEINKFDFPRLKPHDVSEHAKMSDEEIAIKMIDLAKNSVTRRFGDEMKVSDIIEDQDSKRKRQIQSPSMLELGCNTMEAVRLRTDLI